MRPRRPAGAGWLAGAALGLAACAGPGPWVVPRTPEGRPDLQGDWTNGTMTPLQRPEGEPRALTPEQVAAREARRQQFIEGRNAPGDPDRAAPPIGGDGSTGAAGGVGGYNYFWIDAGDRIAVFNGEFRTSLVHAPGGRSHPRSDA